MNTANINLDRSRGAKIKSRGFPILESREVKRSKLNIAEIKGLGGIHQVLSRENHMLLANQIKEIFIVI